MLNDVVVENDEEEQEEEGKNEEEDGGKDDEGKEEEEEEKDLVDLVDLVEEEQGEEDMELEIEEKEKNSELVEEPRWAGLLPKKEVNDEGGDQSVPAPFFITKSENDGEEEQRNPDTQSARPGAASATTTPEHEWLAQLPSFVGARSASHPNSSNIRNQSWFDDDCTDTVPPLLSLVHSALRAAPVAENRATNRAPTDR